MKKIERPHLGSLLRNWRIGEGVTMKQAAKQIGIDVATLSRLETGITDPSKISTDSFVKLICWLMGWKYEHRT